jgi:NAD(P)-dependent dehydrogenase (short-subunit alcohol dehydrogenase family)
MSRFAERVAVVTGGAQGIGRQVVEQLYAEGASVLILDADAELAEATAQAIGSRVVAMGGDVARRSDVAEAVDACVDRFGRIDVMAAHAGIADIEPFMEIGDASWQRMMDVNVNGAFFCTQEAARHMLAAGIRGSIVVTCSTNAFWVESNAAHYNASKGAVATFVRSAGLDLAPHGIRVNGVDPGLIRTRLTRYVTDIPENAADYLPRIPLGRFGEPRDIAEAILFLASDQSAWITGQRICVDGGQTLGTPLPLPDEPLPGSHRGAGD